MNGTNNRCPRLAIFNHKGGVGKTTLTANVAFALAELGQRVLIVDSDPQCNLTAYLIEESVVNDLLDRSDMPEGTTLWSALKPIFDATGDFRQVGLVEIGAELLLAPGDIRLAEFEAELTTYWSECFQRRPRGFRGTTGLSRLVTELAARNDASVVLYDTGPNIGALNRVILLDCDYFAIPAACDLFSLRAIKTLGHTLASWITEWRTISEFAPDGAPLLPGRPAPLGYVAQRFRVYGGQPSIAFAQLMPRLEKAVVEDVLTVLARVDPQIVRVAVAPLRIGEIKDFGALANASQQRGVAMWNVDAGTPAQRDDAKRNFAALAREIAARIGVPLPAI